MILKPSKKRVCFKNQILLKKTDLDLKIMKVISLDCRDFIY